MSGILFARRTRNLFALSFRRSQVLCIGTRFANHPILTKLNTPQHSEAPRHPRTSPPKLPILDTQSFSCPLHTATANLMGVQDRLRRRSRAFTSAVVGSVHRRRASEMPLGWLRGFGRSSFGRERGWECHRRRRGITQPRWSLSENEFLKNRINKCGELLCAKVFAGW